MSIATGVVFGLAPAIQASRPDLVVELKEKTERAGRIEPALQPAQRARVGAGGAVARRARRRRTVPPQPAARAADQPGLRRGASRRAVVRPRRAGLHRRARAPVPAARARAGGIGARRSGGIGREHRAAVRGRLRADGVSRRAGRIGSPRRPAGADQRRRLALPRDASASRCCAAGRLSETDQPNTPIAVVINETMAKRFWPDQDAIGKRFKFFGQDFFNQVVGIAKDSKYNFIGEEATPFIYQATTQVYQPQLSLFVKASQPSAVLGTVRGRSAAARSQPAADGRVHADRRSSIRRCGRRGWRAWLLAVFAGLSLVLVGHRHLRRDGVRREPADARAGDPHGARREPRRRPASGRDAGAAADADGRRVRPRRVACASRA